MPAAMFPRAACSIPRVAEGQARQTHVMEQMDARLAETQILALHLFMQSIGLKS
jgi:hypothetical protein